jgi:hypothetical protein
MLTFVVGLGMIAGEFRSAARFLDWSEVHGAKSWRFITAAWRSSVFAKSIIVLCVIALMSASGYAAHWLFFSG